MRSVWIWLMASIVCLVAAGPASAALQMYWMDANYDKISVAPTIVDPPTQVILQFDSSAMPAGLALDLGAGKIYWVERLYPSPSINRADLDGSNAETVVDLAAAGYSEAIPYAIALDTQHQVIYWTDIGLGKIFRANFDGTGLTQVPNIGIDHSFGLAYHPDQGKLYWTDWNLHGIYRANVDGSEIETLLQSSRDLAHVAGIALDPAGGWMYWANQNSHKIQGASLSNPGGTFTTIYNGGSGFYPRDIAVDPLEGELYWTTVSTNPRIQRSDLNGHNVETLLSLTGDGLYPVPVSIALVPVPEPSSLVIWSAGLLAAAGLAWGRKRLVRS